MITLFSKWTKKRGGEEHEKEKEIHKKKEKKRNFSPKYNLYRRILILELQFKNSLKFNNQRHVILQIMGQ